MDGDKNNIFRTAEDKIEDLKEAIREIGFNIEETEDGIRITE